MKDSKPYYPRKRNRAYKGEYHPKVGNFISKHYERLRVELKIKESVNYAGMSDEDVMSETFILVSYNPQAPTMSESEILEHFKYKYKMLYFQTTRDAKSMRITDNVCLDAL